MGTVEDDCDRKVLKKNREYAVKLKTMEELYLRTIREADEFKLKQKLYVKTFRGCTNIGRNRTRQNVSDKTLLTAKKNYI